MIEQRGFGENPAYYGFIGEEKVPVPVTTTLGSSKIAVESSYLKSHPQAAEPAY